MAIPEFPVTDAIFTANVQNKWLSGALVPWPISQASHEAVQPVADSAKDLSDFFATYH